MSPNSGTKINGWCKCSMDTSSTDSMRSAVMNQKHAELATLIGPTQKESKFYDRPIFFKKFMSSCPALPTCYMNGELHCMHGSLMVCQVSDAGEELGTYRMLQFGLTQVCIRYRVLCVWFLLLSCCDDIMFRSGVAFAVLSIVPHVKIAMGRRHSPVRMQSFDCLASYGQRALTAAI